MHARTTPACRILHPATARHTRCTHHTRCTRCTCCTHTWARMRECTRASDYPLKKLYTIMVEFLHLSPTFKRACHLHRQHCTAALPILGMPCPSRQTALHRLSCAPKLHPQPPHATKRLPLQRCSCRCWRACSMRTTRTPTSGCCWPCAARAAATRRARSAQVNAGCGCCCVVGAGVPVSGCTRAGAWRVDA